MAKRGQGRATIAIAGLTAVMIVAGLFMTGGPQQGRAERRDQERSVDLSRLESHLTCLSREAGQVVTEPQPDNPACLLPDGLVDPASGAAYRIEKIDDNNLRLCADFETDDVRHSGGFHTYIALDSDGCRPVYLDEGRLNRTGPVVGQSGPNASY